MIQSINLKTLQSLTHQMERLGVSYGFGIKSPMHTPIDKIKKGDCSWFARYAWYHSTKPNQVIPDGSWNQRRWFEQQGATKIAYTTAIKDPHSTLYIAFMDPIGKIPGHVWYVNDGVTFECHGGKGVDSRPASTPVLLHDVDHCFVIPHIWV